MMELTDRQIQALNQPAGAPTRLVNPRTNETFVLVPVEEYERLTGESYDDSPWTAEERLSLAWKAGASVGWDDMDEYDALPEKP